MPTADQISRIHSDPDALDFATLRKDALSIIQDLCGENWTDYNLHDPGVTILEQLCYALTDLSYRSEFPVADYLSGSDGSIDYSKQSLYPPHEVFPSAAVTQTDYEKILYDAVPEIDRVWFRTDSFEHEQIPGLTGLYTVYVKIDQDLLQTQTNDSEKPPNLEPIVVQIVRLETSVTHWHALTGQISTCLQTRRNLLKRWHDRLSHAGGHAFFEQSTPMIRLLEKSGEILIRLDKQLSGCLDIRDGFGAIRGLLFKQTFSPESIKRLGKQLSRLEQQFNTLLPGREYEQILAMLDTPLNKPDDLTPVLENVLPRLTVALGEKEQILRALANNLITAQNSLRTFYETAVMKKIRAVFYAHRNLCEDVHTIRMVETQPFFLTGEIEIHPLHHPAKVYAEIFFKCSRYISSNIQIDHYGAVLAGKRNYEQVFSGPLTHHGYIRDESLAASRRIITVVDLMTCIRSIKGVVQIRSLSLTDEAGNRRSNLNDYLSQHVFPVLHFSHASNVAQVLQLALPFDKISVHASAADGSNTAVDRKNTALFDEFQRELKKLVFEYQAFRRNTQPITNFFSLPSGQSRPLNHYYSIQNHFPAIYGINKEGIPRSQPLDVRAKAKQLKAYLFPFEQLMANYLEGLQQIPVLFSANHSAEKTYFSQYLDNGKVPDIEPLYIEHEADGNLSQSSLIDDILRQYDDYTERKNRILDILLALYGESYEQQALLRFNYYRREDPFNWILEQKISYLKLIRQISRDRCKGFDFSRSGLLAHAESAAEKPSGLHAKISLLLGLQCAKTPVWIADILIQRKSRLVADRILADRIKSVTDDGQSETVPDRPDCPSAESVDMIIPSQLPVFSYSIFKEGIQLDNYRLLRLNQEETAVCFKSEQDARLWILTTESSFDEAALYTHRFCGTLNKLNRTCENFHLIEHLLLRPRGKESLGRLGVEATFFNCRVSVVFPSWTACFSDIAFRCFAEEIIQKNLPAHVFADIYWLDFLSMHDFEERYQSWLHNLQQYSQDDDAEILSQLDQASEKMTAFLLDYKQKENGDYWL
ncbi:hypothetical protein [Nitrosomonas sp.]|uniref:hypothetical protein n=1 Tax=Nitrosomonas sp. TaxID=42353 RepID=UPI002845492B|nr:hypothetical protein [Nitrosomonas sp.]MDR4515329.1 hypothetical protein [Nitrosomonas sp.]